MPSYDVECSKCSYEDVESIKLADLAAWDLNATCPKCSSVDGVFRRVIKHAPVNFGGVKATANSEKSRKLTAQQKFVGSGEKDAMLHRNAKHHDSDRAAAARESAKKGEFEGF